VPIGRTMTTPELHDALAELGPRLLQRALAENPTPEPQPADGVTYAPKLTKADGRLDWSQPAAALDRRIRALNPWPGTFCQHGPDTLRILEADPAAGSGTPGTLLDAFGLVATGDGALRLRRLQRPGRAAQPWPELVRGYSLPPGTVLG